MKLWAGRFQKETDTLVNDFNSSIQFDARLYKQDIAGSIAHAQMLGKQGIIEEHEVEAIVDGLKAILEDIESDKVEFSVDNEDIHMNIETLLTQRIGDAGGNEVLPCKGVVGLDGLFAQVSAGHDKRVNAVRRGCGEQQMLKRGVGEHDAKLGQVARDGWREFEGVGGAVGVVAGCAATQQHNGTNTAGQQVALNAIDMTQALGVGKAAHHNGERLIAATLATAQLAHRLFVGGIAGQVESAQTLDGDDAAASQQLDAAFDDGIAGLARGADGWCRVGTRWHNTAIRLAPRNMRSAIKAGIGLRVKTPVERIGILRGTLGAHGKTVHRGSRSIVRQRADDGKARSTVGAVDKGIMKASVGGVEQLAQAVIARSDVGRDERRVGGLILRRHNAKTLLVGGVPVAGC